MTDVIIHTGKKGNTGTAGTAGVSVSGVRKSLISKPCLNLFRANNLDSDITWTRDADASFIDRYGNSSFVSGDSFTQKIRRTDNYNSAANYWEYPNLDTTIVADRTANDQLGGTDATTLEFTGTDDSDFGMVGYFTGANVSQSDVYRVSFYARLVTGTIDAIELQFGGSAVPVQTINKTITTDWQRFDIITQAGATAGSFRLFFRTATTAQIDLFRVNITSGTTLQDAVFYDGATDQIVSNTNPVYRQNKSGYLIEGQKENLCPSSQALNQWATTGAPVISQYTDADPYGVVDLPILITFGSTQSISVFNNVSVTEGGTYAVSFFAKVVSGAVENITVSLGGAEPQTIDITSEYVRYELFLTAGGNGRIAFNAATATASTAFIITAVQIELGQHSSYVYTASLTNTRNPDLVSMSGNKLPALNNAFTVQCALRNVDYPSGLESTVFCTNDGFSLRFDNAGGLNRAVIYTSTNNGFVAHDQCETNLELIVTHDGNGVLKYYYNGVFVGSETATGFISVEQSTLYLGATDNAGSNALNASIKCLRAWDFEATADEIKYISESYNGNRFSDRG